MAVTRIDKPLTELLWDKAIDSVAVTLASNERPPQKLASLFDWNLRGLISSQLKSGFLTGEPGECSFFPIEKNGYKIHILTVGIGHRDSRQIPTKYFEILSKNFLKSGNRNWGISHEDFGSPDEKVLSKFFDECRLTVAL